MTGRPNGIRIVRFDEARDSFEDLTRLLNAAYRRLAEMGLNYVAATQDAETTRRRARAATACWVALQDATPVGVICYYGRGPHPSQPAWYRRGEVGHFGQFAVEPSLQRSGIGSRMLAAAEERAAADGKTEFSCDTAEPATHLLSYYARRGFRAIGQHRWPHARYVSIILSKRLDVTVEQATEADLPAMLAIVKTTPWNKDDYLRRQLANDCILVARAGGAIVGLIAWNREFFGKPFVWLCVVEPANRSNGIGTLLFSHVESRVGRIRLYSSTNRSNEAMRRFLVRRGYRCAGEVDLDPGDPEAFYYLDP